MPALSSPGETIGTGQACSLRVARLFGRGFDSPRLQNFASRNFVLSEPAVWGESKGKMASQNFVLSKPRFQGASKGKITMFYAYILRCSDDSYYVGSSDDPDRRLIEHNQGKGSDWTAARRPVALVWTEEHSTLSSARKRENQIKRWNRAKKDALVGGSLRLRSGRA